jgi:hypothetical protein
MRASWQLQDFRENSLTETTFKPTDSLLEGLIRVLVLTPAS